MWVSKSWCCSICLDELWCWNNWLGVECWCLDGFVNWSWCSIGFGDCYNWFWNNWSWHKFLDWSDNWWYNWGGTMNNWWWIGWNTGWNVAQVWTNLFFCKKTIQRFQLVSENVIDRRWFLTWLNQERCWLNNLRDWCSDQWFMKEAWFWFWSGSSQSNKGRQNNLEKEKNVTKLE